MRNIIASFLLAVCACYGPFLFMRAAHHSRHVSRAVYSWQTRFYLGTGDEAFLHAHGISKIYVKIMDIGWNPVYGAYPLTATPIDYQLEHDSAMEVVPVIFITNEAVKHTALKDMAALAAKIAVKMDQLCGHTDKTQELQVDCDWTASSEEQYFALLNEIRKQRQGYIISATIRLHQFKNSEKTGVPPVDKGMLMMYNMGRIADYNESNSIFNMQAAIPYLADAGDYPLPLDIALPSFNWGIVFRNRQFEKIFHRINRQTADTCTFLVKQPNGMYRVNVDYWSDDHGNYLRYGDEIRIEDMDEKTLLQAAGLATAAVNNDYFTVSLFELNSDALPTIDSAAYEKVFDRFK